MQQHTPPKLRRRLLAALGLLAAGRVGAANDDKAAWAALREGAIVLFRHAHAPGVGDPANFSLGDCRTKRNLDTPGQAPARRIGASAHRRIGASAHRRIGASANG